MKRLLVLMVSVFLLGSCNTEKTLSKQIKYDWDINYTILRFATAFGHSPNMRFDLTLNEFTAMQYFDKYLVIEITPDLIAEYSIGLDILRLL